MANAFMTGNTGGNALAEAPLGTGLARGAIDILKLREEWQRLYTDGDTNLQFRDWLSAQGIINPVMPR